MKTLAFLLLLSLFTVAHASEQGSYKIKWVLAHEPIGLFKEAANVFSKEVTQKTKGKVTFEILTMAEYEAKYSHKKVSYTEFLNELQNGSIEMSQTYTTELGKLNNSFYVLDLPFLFRNHKHAQKVLEGKIGQNLLSSLSASQVRGLAFTYSGGFRVVPGTKPIRKMEDFQGQKVRTSSSPIAQETFNILGAKAVPLDLSDIDDAIKAGKIDQAESTYARYFTLGQDSAAKIVNETNHSLFLTSIIINEKFWQTLPEEYRKIMSETAVKAARLERDHSVAEGVKTRKQCLDSGIQVVSMSQKEEARMKKALMPVYKKFAPMIGEQLISSIEKQ